MVAKYARNHGITRAAGHFTRIFGTHVSTSTVQYIRDAYSRQLREKRARDEENENITSLPCLKRGRRLLTGETIDSRVQAYLKKVREGGGVVTSRVAVAAARGILLACNRSSLMEFGGNIDLNPSWVILY